MGFVLFEKGDNMRVVAWEAVAEVIPLGEVDELAGVVQIDVEEPDCWRVSRMTSQVSWSGVLPSAYELLLK